MFLMRVGQERLKRVIEGKPDGWRGRPLAGRDDHNCVEVFVEGCTTVFVKVCPTSSICLEHGHCITG
jgi:hypothetical protein